MPSGIAYLSLRGPDLRKASMGDDQELVVEQLQHEYVHQQSRPAKQYPGDLEGPGDEASASMFWSQMVQHKV